MRFIKTSTRENPKISFILLDWSVRESFHILHYLKQQNCDRDDYEVIIIEYYDRVSEAIKVFEEQVDTWLLMEIPEDCYYHKHLMYNVGIVLAKGSILSICDSDAMVRPGHVHSIIQAFNNNPNIILHIDQFRNNSRALYPFSYPEFEEVLGTGCINNINGKTTGICDNKDPIHTRNYGACMCAKKDDLVSIGGADEYGDYIGHICGPYDMTFRLINSGKKEVWSQEEFTYHTWHPGQAGVDNYLGPHDGKHMSTASLLSLVEGRILPIKENTAVRMLREHSGISSEELINYLVNNKEMEYWKKSRLNNINSSSLSIDREYLYDFYLGTRINKSTNGFIAKWITNSNSAIYSKTLPEVKQHIKRQLPVRLQAMLLLYSFLSKLRGLKRKAVIFLKSPTIINYVRKTKKFKSRRNTDTHLNSFLSGITNLIAYSFLMRDNIDKTVPPTVVITDVFDCRLVKTFIYINMLPPLNVSRVNSVTDLEKITSDNINKTSVWMAAATYVRFYPALTCKSINNLVIV